MNSRGATPTKAERGLVPFSRSFVSLFLVVSLFVCWSGMTMARHGWEMLLGKLRSFPLEPYHLQSRVHRLRMSPSVLTPFYAKRDDELGFGVSGAKLRKFSSLIGHLKREQFGRVILIGERHPMRVSFFVDCCFFFFFWMKSIKSNRREILESNREPDATPR
jgi:hypothetical protein